MSVSTLIFLAVGLVVIAVLAWGSASIRSDLYLHALCRGGRNERSVALTFDDGPDPVRTPEVLDVLARYGVRATFFLVGEKAAAYPELVRRIVAEGHVVGNHTHTHKGFFPLYGSRRIAGERRSAGVGVHAITGRRPRFFRPPFGVTNPAIGRSVRRAGLATVGWSIRSLDTVTRTPRETVLARVLGKLHPGAVILLHDRCPRSAWLTERLLEALGKRGYSVNTVERMFDIDAYED